VQTGWPAPEDEEAFCPPELPSEVPAERTLEEEVVALRELFGLSTDATSVAVVIDNLPGGHV
jgi:hypothetical protein